MTRCAESMLGEHSTKNASFVQLVLENVKKSDEEERLVYSDKDPEIVFTVGMCTVIQ